MLIFFEDDKSKGKIILVVLGKNQYALIEGFNRCVCVHVYVYMCVFVWVYVCNYINRDVCVRFGPELDDQLIAVQVLWPVLAGWQLRNIGCMFNKHYNKLQHTHLHTCSFSKC